MTVEQTTDPVVAGVEVELGAGTEAARPARGHRLQSCVEVYAFRSIDAMGPEDRGLPAPEGMVTDRNGDWDIDPNHAHLDAPV